MKDSDFLGKTVAVSTEGTLVIRLNQKRSIEGLTLGGYVSIIGKHFTYICKIIQMESYELERNTADMHLQLDNLERSGIKVGTLPLSHFGRIGYNIHLKALRLLSHRDESISTQPKTIPPLYSIAHSTLGSDIQKLYSKDKQNYIELGDLIGIIGSKVPAKVNLEKLMSLHGGIFGKTGSGKTYLAKLIIGHIISQPKRAALIFDMHDEYGYKIGVGLKQYFNTDLRVVGLKGDDEIDETMEIPREQVTLTDLLMAIPDFTDAQKRALYTLEERFSRGSSEMSSGNLKEGATQKREHWFDILMEYSSTKLKQELGQEGEIKRGTLEIVKKNVRLFFDRLPFIVKSTSSGKDTAENILDWLSRGKSVVVNFGKYSNDSAVYAIATNMIARRLLDLYRERYGKADGRFEELPRVMIMLEEAHKFLNARNLNSSFFGKFVREARKFRLGLLIVDQSPSQIHEEVMAQLGTQFVLQLGNENDKRSVITLSEEDLSEYKQEISSLNTREVLISGKASDFLQTMKSAEFAPANLTRIWHNVENGKNLFQPEHELGGI